MIISTNKIIEMIKELKENLITIVIVKLKFNSLKKIAKVLGSEMEI